MFITHSLVKRRHLLASRFSFSLSLSIYIYICMYVYIEPCSFRQSLHCNISAARRSSVHFFLRITVIAIILHKNRSTLFKVLSRRGATPSVDRFFSRESYPRRFSQRKEERRRRRRRRRRDLEDRGTTKVVSPENPCCLFFFKDAGTIPGRRACW